MGLSDGEEIMTLALSVFDTIPAVTDGQTDGHVAVAKTALRTMHSVALGKTKLNHNVTQLCTFLIFLLYFFSFFLWLLHDV